MRLVSRASLAFSLSNNNIPFLFKFSLDLHKIIAISNLGFTISTKWMAYEIAQSLLFIWLYQMRINVFGDMYLLDCDAEAEMSNSLPSKFFKG